MISKTGPGVTTAMVDGKLSYKMVLAFFFPLIAGLAGVATHWVVTGQWDATESRLVAADFGASAVAALGAYVGAPGLTRAVRK